MRFGAFVTPPTAWPFVKQGVITQTLYNVALEWLKEDRDHRKQLEAQGRKTRGARRDDVGPTSAGFSFLKASHRLP